MWLAVDKSTNLWGYHEKPIRDKKSASWITNGSIGSECLKIERKHLFLEMIGRVLTWDNEPIELVVKDDN